MKKTNIAKLYLHQIKTLLPLHRQAEKEYLIKYRQAVQEYCDVTSVDNLSVLYKEFGTPNEVVYNYVSLIEPAELSALLIKKNKIRIFLSVALITLTLISIAYLSCLLLSYKYILDTETTYIETTITKIE